MARCKIWAVAFLGIAVMGSRRRCHPAGEFPGSILGRREAKPLLNSSAVGLSQGSP